MRTQGGGYLSPPTNILFTRTGLQNADGLVKEGSSFRIHLKSSEVGECIDLANSTLNFNL